MSTPPSILQIKSGEIDNVEKRRNYTVSIIGCGSIGVLNAYFFAEAGFKVICADADQAVANLLAKGRTLFSKHEMETKLKDHAKAGHLSATNDIKTAVSQSSIIAIAISARIDEKKKPDYSHIERTCKQVGSSLPRGSLVIVVSVVGFGVIEGMFREILENTSGLKAGVDFGLAYSPIQLPHKQTSEMVASYERIVAAADKTSLNASATVLETLSGSRIRKTNNLKAAEMGVLFEATKQNVNTALVNELALLCEKAGIDYSETQKLANPNTSNMLFSPTLADESDQEEPYLLLESAENLNSKLRIVSSVREINEEIIRHAADLTKDALRNCEKTMTRARVSLLGISQTPNEKSLPKRAVKELAKTLETRGVRVSFYDPHFSENEVGELQPHFKKSLTEAVEGADCIMIITGHDQFKRLNLKKLKVMMKMPAAIVDLEGILEPDKVEKEGFIYRGLGRGVWTK